MSNLENIQKTTLRNGLVVVTETMTHVRSVTAGIWVKAGSRYEQPRQNGIAHFIEHMLFKGTAGRSAEEIAKEVDSLGGNLDAYTSKEMVCFNCKMLDEHLPQAFDILADLVLNPMFRPGDIEKERGVILEELKSEFDSPEVLIHDVFSASFWKGNSLAQPILGTKKTLNSFHEEMVREFFETFYVPSNIVITAAGHLNHDDFLKLVEERFGHLQSPKTIPQPKAPTPKAEVILKNKRSLEQVHVVLGVPCVDLRNDMRFASYALNTLLGGSMSSRLFQNVREKRGLAYTVGSEQFMYADAGCLAVYAGTSMESVPELLRLVMLEFKDLKESPVPAEELRRAKDNLKGSLMLGLESTGSRMAHLARQHIYYGRFASMDELAEAIENITAAQLQELANQCFVSGDIALTLLGKLSGLSIGREDLVC